jgi:hypothetical protein
MEPMGWVAIARTLWAHRRKFYAGAAMLAPFALTAVLAPKAGRPSTCCH